MKRLIKVPFLGSNDSDCELVEWSVDQAEEVKSGTFLFALETTKAINEVIADSTAICIKQPKWDGVLKKVRWSVCSVLRKSPMSSS